MKKLLFIILFVLPITSMAQYVGSVKGTVTDLITGEPLKDSHVYLNDKYGVVSDKDGTFELFIPDDLANEILKVSYVGYKTFELPVNEALSESLSIEMESSILVLPTDAVVVTPDSWDYFRDAVVTLLDENPNRAELYASIQNELKEIDPELKDAWVYKKGEYTAPIFVAIIFLLVVMIPINIQRINRFLDRVEESI